MRISLFCLPELIIMKATTIAHNGGSRTLLVSRGVTERGGGRSAVWLRGYFS
jgi:hypothetical protein